MLDRIDERASLEEQQAKMISPDVTRRKSAMIFKRDLPSDRKNKKSPNPDIKNPQNPMLKHMGTEAEALAKSRILSEKLEEQTKAASLAQNMSSLQGDEER